MPPELHISLLPLPRLLSEGETPPPPSPLAPDTTASNHGKEQKRETLKLSSPVQMQPPIGRWGLENVPLYFSFPLFQVFCPLEPPTPPHKPDSWHKLLRDHLRAYLSGLRI